MVSGLVVDLDGVVYRGSTPIEGAVEAVNLLSARTRVLFVTNNSSRSREDYGRSLAALGIDMGRCSVLPSSRATALYLASKGVHRALVVGEQGLLDELRLAKVEPVESGADAVVVGLDRGFSYPKMARALRELQAGAAFVATNTDPTLPSEDGPLPGNGAQVAAIRCASGREPVVVGKPSRIMMGLALSELGVPARRALVVGDRLDTDVIGGKRAGAVTCLVLTGSTSRADLESSGIEPDVVADSLADLPGILGLRRRPLRD